ncbi:hypothetical protein ACHAQJ_009271 [Trichoderma viride]
MTSQYRSAAPLPQGFSVYQPQLGAQLQFFPALGTQELDDMMNAYIPGSVPLKEKRATISLDFLEHAQLTGQTFKFYPVYSSSPVAASPVNSISTSSFSNTSPVNSTWEWSQASASPSVSSRSSISKSRRAPQGSSSNLASRYPTPDLSHLPGMKIMTKDGQDVTDSASRGSKTKEQRDHAHLMRIIKACDSCRRKKIKCDPSHKKRTASQAQPHSVTKQAKKARTAAAAVMAAATATPQKPAAAVAICRGQDDNPDMAMSLFGLDPTFTFTGLDSFESNDQMCESWEEFIQYPPADVEDNYDFFLDPEGYLSSQSSASSSSASPAKAFTPASQQDSLVAMSGLEEGEGMSSGSASPQLPFLQENHNGFINSYTDFNLFSPSSSFSEDDRMVPISSTRLLSPSQPSTASESEMFAYNGFDVDGHGLATDWSGTSAPVSPLEEAGLVAAANTSLPWYDPGPSSGESREQDSRAGISITPHTGWVGDLRIAHSPGGSVLVTASSTSGMEVTANTDIQDKSEPYGDSPVERGRIRSESPACYSAQLSPGQAVFRTVCLDVTTIIAALLTTDMEKQELTSDQTTTPSTMATAANNSVDYSTGSVESPSRVRTEHLASVSVTPGVSPGNLQLSYGGATPNTLPGSAAFAAASENTTTVISPQPSFAALVSIDPATTEFSGSRGSLSAQQHNGEVVGHRQSAAPLAEDGIQPTSLLLLRATAPKQDMRAVDEECADFGQSLSVSRWFGLEALAQITSVMLVASLACAIFASMTGAPALFCFASLVPVMGAILQSVGTAQSDLKSFGTTSLTMSSSRSNVEGSPLSPSSYRRKSSFAVGKAQPPVLRHDLSRFTSFFSSSSPSRSLASCFVAPLMG